MLLGQSWAIYWGAMEELDLMAVMDSMMAMITNRTLIKKLSKMWCKKLTKKWSKNMTNRN